jgi:hypothetical protein
MERAWVSFCDRRSAALRVDAPKKGAWGGVDGCSGWLVTRNPGCGRDAVTRRGREVDPSIYDTGFPRLARFGWLSQISAAEDACACLGIANHRMALRRVDPGDKGVISTDTLGGSVQKIAVLNESGLYALVLRRRTRVCGIWAKSCRHLPDVQ